MIFAGSCCCCSIVFLTAEHSRMKEGLSFREAYLIPIPLVAAEIDSGDKDYLFPPDQPTAIARAHTSIDIPVAEPTENSSLVGRYIPDRNTLWDWNVKRKNSQDRKVITKPQIRNWFKVVNNLGNLNAISSQYSGVPIRNDFYCKVLFIHWLILWISREIFVCNLC